MSEYINNDHLVLISGESSTGKSASLVNLNNPEGVMYLNCENKKLPFKSKFQEFMITDPYQVYEAFDYAEEEDSNIHTIVVDTLTFMMDRFESLHVIGASNTQSQWSAYAQFFKNLMQDKVANSTKNVIFLAHTKKELNESTGINEVAVPIKGSLKGNGIEAYFSIVVSSKKVPLKELNNYKNSMLNITPDDELIGYKHVFQTRPTKGTVGERIRSPLGLFTVEQTYIDNNAQVLMQHISDYYA